MPLGRLTPNSNRDGKRESIMPTSIDRDDVQRLLGQGAQLVDVLPPQEYHDQHLPGAMSIPLKELNAEAAGRLLQDQPIIVYCYDHQ
jgi:rhodanese-related sulfurtransferase